MKVKSECLNINCGNEYLLADSDAKNQSMYCSASCENEEEFRLTEGNRIIDAAIAEDPASFHRTISPLQSLAADLARAQASVESKTVLNIVDSMFNKLNGKE